MQQATRNRDVFSLSFTGSLGRGTREGAFIVFAALALFLLLSFASYHPSDPGWSFSRSNAQVMNHGGVVGAWLADVFLYLCGYMAYLFPLLIAFAGILVYRNRAETVGFGWLYLATRGGGFAMTVAAGCGLATIHYGDVGQLPLDAGGILGNVVGNGLVAGFNFLGGTLILLTMFLTGITLFTSLSWLSLMDATGRYTLAAIAATRDGIRRLEQYRRGRKSRRERETTVKAERTRKAKRKPPRIEPTVGTIEPSVRVEKERQVPLFEPPAESSLPPLAILEAPAAARRGMSEASLDAMSRQVELKLKDYGIEVEVDAVHPGPVVTRFELKLAPGLKVSRVTGLAKDLARSLSTVSVRVVEVIPGKSVIGLEIPNEEVELVRLSEILKSTAYDESSSPLTLALGKDVAGHPLVVNLDRMPHLLVAGTTGSGKSVAINAMVLSILYKTTARDVRLIMIDPKMLELSVYEDIPHLLSPVVTDMKDAGNALRWCVAEMDRRYELMSALGVRNIGGYNRKIKDAAAAGKPLRSPFADPGGEEPPPLEPLPFIVVFVDELADMMMVTGKKVEELIARLAQKARASGIHLILATQRPSVDVITGLIKANIPSRIAFQVSSKVDSRTILDQGGADMLLGHGDMLYTTPGMPTPTRVHGAFVSDAEVHRVVAHLRKSGKPQYVDDVLAGGGEAAGGDAGAGFDGAPDPESDPLYDQAVSIVTETRRASISGVQRRLKIGYNRAARMIEQMEHAGLVGPLQSNGSREVLASPAPEG